MAILTMLTGSVPTTSTAFAAPDLPARPFPQHTTYQEGAILPNHISQQGLDDSVRSFYLAWKEHYIRSGCTPGEKYVWFEGTKSSSICVSEGQGYGMMITALMAGSDSTAQETFDALFRFYRSHPGTTSPHLMAWTQSRDCQSLDGSTATDGDMDIAYSLLLADAQWGQHSAIPYRQEALEMIAAIRREEINPRTYTVMESNHETPRSEDFYDMRSSDFMPEHIRAFRRATGDAVWDTVLDNNYRVFHYLQNTYSPDAGLIPDFIKNISLAETITAVPAQPHYLESKYDGLYNFNACRVPWRIAADFLVSGDQRAADFLAPINSWIRSTTKDNPDNISAGYDLSGADLPHRYFEALCFICPFAVSAMASPENQVWLNKLWDYIVDFKLKDFDYYDNSIKMIDMIILSGNYWAP
ncbi:licheninase [Puia dinghuensis]|uniref:Glucanase n=2 Tax=Puia dinghuensis TaxID=1792502 RepID=A0A8J2UAB7_9BACT|nr:licheninase [Puia dinghuensis]